MKYVLIREYFELNKFIEKEKISPEILSVATNKIEPFYKNELPFDIKKKKPNLILWLCRILKNEKDLNKIDWSKYTKAFDYIFSMNRNPNIFKIDYTANLEKMTALSDTWHKKIESSTSGRIKTEEGYIIKTYPDGFYWIDLLTNSCREEGDAMGHCGRTSAETILSLRKKSMGKIEPFVTIAIDYTDFDEVVEKTIEEGGKPRYSNLHQCKGKGNKKPNDTYHPYIVDFLLDEDFDVQKLDLDEYSPNDDFHVSDLDKADIDKIFELKPNFILEDSYFDYGKILKDEEIANKILNYYTDKELELPILAKFLLYKHGKYPFEGIKKISEAFFEKNGELYIETKADGLASFAPLYSGDDDNREHMSSRDFIEQVDDHDHVHHDYNTPLKDVFNNISDENLKKIYELIVAEGYDEDIDNMDAYIIEEYDNVYEIIRKCIDETCDEVHYDDMYKDLEKPIKAYFGNIFNYDELPFIFQHIGCLSGFQPYDFKNAIDIYEKIFSIYKEDDEDDDEFFKINFPYHGWSYYCDDDIFNKKLKEYL